MDKFTLKGTWYKTTKQDRQATGGAKQTERGGVRPYKIKRGEKKTPLACMFIPRSRGGVLANRIKEKEETLSKASLIKVKIVEKAGVKLEHVLTKSNPFKEQFMRPNCNTCQAKGPSWEVLQQEHNIQVTVHPVL